jgi:ELWxxDGT repeat protein
MKTKIFTLQVILLLTSTLAGQNLPEGMEKLTPEGVTVNIEAARCDDKQKNLIVAGNPENGYKAFFSATDDTHGEELWVSDGTIKGTKMVKDIFPGTTGSDIAWMKRFNDKVVFQAQSDPDTGVELWISDGTEEGTYMVKDIHEFGSSFPAGFTQVNETQFVFVAKDFDSEIYNSAGAQRWLWVSDGTESGTRLVMECDTRFPGKNTATRYTHFMRVGRKVFFKSDSKDKEYGEELWITDGTREGTYLVKDINTEKLSDISTADNAFDHFINFYNEKLFFRAFSIEHANEPWASDGTNEGTYLIKDVDPTSNANNFPNSSGLFMPEVYKNKVYMRAKDPNLFVGSEVMVTDMSEGNFELFYDINQNPTPTGTEDGFPYMLGEFDGVLWFKGRTGSDATLTGQYGGNYGIELFYTDGTQNQIVMNSDLNPGIGDNQLFNPIVVSGSYYFCAQNETPASGSALELFRIDYKEQTPVKVVDLVEGNDLIHSLANLGGDLIFTSNNVKSLFRYHYRKDNYDPEVDSDNLEINYKTRDEMTDEILLQRQVSKLIIYPNPTRSYFRFDVPGELIEMTISDITGKIICKDKLLLSKQKDISFLSEGIYSVFIKTTEGSFNERLMVN